MNITQSGLITSSRLDFTSNALYTRASSGSSTFIPTRDEAKSNHETDKQNEDNTTWFLEYKALLNSKLTTLITSLTNAYTTDLDAAMGTPDSSLALPWSKTNMQGFTGEKDTSTPPKTRLDPGALRASFAYLKTFNSALSATSVNPNNTTWWDQADQATTTYKITNTNGLYTTSTTERDDVITGTTTFTTSKAFELDRLQINISVANQVSANPSSPTYVMTKIDKPGLETAYKTRNIGNNFLLTLYKFFERPENMDLLKFDMFKDVYVIGTSSLPTGSQMQGSISLNWITPGSGSAYISIRQERFAAFYHS